MLLVLLPAASPNTAFASSTNTNTSIAVSSVASLNSPSISHKANTGIIVPLYFSPYPDGLSGPFAYQAVVNVSQKYPLVPIVAIINPNSGPETNCGSPYQTAAEIQTAVSKLNASGVIVLGYVWTNNGVQNTSLIESEIDIYHNCYAAKSGTAADGLAGIMFDGMGVNESGTMESYYATLTKYAKQTDAFKYVFGNPGTDTYPGYIGTVDTINTFEGPGWTLNSSLTGSRGGSYWHYQYYKGNFSAISYNQTTLPSERYILKSSVYLSYMYITNGIYYLNGSGDPYNSLPPYLSTLTSYLNNSSVSLNIQSELTNGTAITTTNNVIYSGANNSEDEAMNLTTPYNYNATQGWTYLVSAKSQSGYAFDYWNLAGTNSTTNPIAVTPTQATTLTAYYSISSQAQLTVQSAIMNGTVYNGMYTVIEDSSHNILKTGFTPLTYTVTTGSQYIVQVDNYGVYTFDHWSTGSTSDPVTITPTQATTLTAYFSTPLGIDGVANSGYCDLGTCLGSSGAVTLSTRQTDETVMLYTTLKPGTVTGVSDSQKLVWRPRYQNTGVFQNVGLFEWYAFAPKALSSDTITVSFSETATNYQIVAFSVYGGIISNFDPNSGLPPFASGSSTSPSVTFSTSNGNDLVIAYMSNVHSGDSVTYPSGYTKITTATTGGWEYIAYKAFSSAQSGTSISWSQSPSDAWAATADALSGAGFLGVDQVANSGYCYLSSCEASSASVKLSTGQTNEIIMVYTTLKPATLVRINDSTGLAWHERFGTYNNQGEYEWYAFAKNALSLDRITVTFSETATNYQIVAFGVYGVDSSSFDPSSGLPATASGSSTSPSVTLSTSNGDDLAIAYMNNVHATDTVTYPTGYTPLTTATTNGWEYIAYHVFVGPQSGTAITWSQSPSDGWVAIADALSG